jgi:hypothetical protein
MNKIWYKQKLDEARFGMKKIWSEDKVVLMKNIG